MFHDTTNLWNMNPLHSGLIITDAEIPACCSCFPCSWQFISSGCHSSSFICLGMYLGNDLCWWWFWSSQGRCTTMICNSDFQILIFYLSTVLESFLRVLLLRTERAMGAAPMVGVAILLWQLIERLNFLWEFFHFFMEGQCSHSLLEE